MNESGMFSLRPDSGVPCAVAVTKISEIQSPVAQSNGCHARLRGWPAKVARPKTAAARLFVVSVLFVLFDVSICFNCIVDLE